MCLRVPVEGPLVNFVYVENRALVLLGEPADCATEAVRAQFVRAQLEERDALAELGREIPRDEGLAESWLAPEQDPSWQLESERSRKLGLMEPCEERVELAHDVADPDDRGPLNGREVDPVALEPGSAEAGGHQRTSSVGSLDVVPPHVAGIARRSASASPGHRCPSCRTRRPG